MFRNRLTSVYLLYSLWVDVADFLCLNPYLLDLNKFLGPTNRQRIVVAVVLCVFELVLCVQAKSAEELVICQLLTLSIHDWLMLVYKYPSSLAPYVGCGQY